MDQDVKVPETKSQEENDKEGLEEKDVLDEIYRKKRRHTRPSARNLNNYIFDNPLPRQIGTQTRNQNRQQSIEEKPINYNNVNEENESVCCQCEGGGELVCCDTCIRAYHIVCLSPNYRPSNYTETSNDLIQWSCPVCLYFHVHENLDKRRGVLLKLNYIYPVPAKDSDPYFETTGSIKKMLAISSNVKTAIINKQKSKEFNHRDLYRESHHHYLFKDISKTQNNHILDDINKKKPQEKKDLPLTSQGCMNVGPSYQIPQLPMSFLEIQDMGRSYHQLNDRYLSATLDSRIVYSATEWKRLANQYKKFAPFETSQQVNQSDQNDLSLLFIFYNAFSVTKFCQALLTKWSARCLWPYSSEFAYKILYHYKFNGLAALNCFDDPSFDFFKVCDPPVKPYLNKWKPKDRRSYFPATPFPPPQHYRSIYSGIRTH